MAFFLVIKRQIFFMATIVYKLRSTTVHDQYKRKRDGVEETQNILNTKKKKEKKYCIHVFKIRFNELFVSYYCIKKMQIFRNQARCLR